MYRGRGVRFFRSTVKVLTICGSRLESPVIASKQSPVNGEQATRLAEQPCVKIHTHQDKCKMATPNLPMTLVFAQKQLSAIISR